jgi:hypothetical protein
VSESKQRAHLQAMYSPDVYGGPGHHTLEELTRALAQWQPRGDFGIVLNLLVGGSADDPATDSFDLTLCTPGWLAERVREQGIVDGRHFLVVHQYDHQLVERYLRERIDAIEGDSWPEVAMQIDELAEWEWKPHPP